MTTMIKILATLLLSFLSSFVSAQKITGTWNGKLKIPTGELPLIFKISNNEEGYKTAIISPAQSSEEFMASATFIRNDSLFIESKALAMSYKGVLKDKEIKGFFTQAGNTLFLNLKKGDIKIAENKVVKRPQDPKMPFPYIEKEVFFENPEANGIKLSGTITLPKNIKNPPIAILISGSGPQNRNQELLNHRPFLVIADHLTRRGIAVLRYDDRGVGKSKGSFKGATSQDFASDVEAAVAFLKKRSDVATDKIGLIGHSEGGLIAPMVAARNKEVKFVVMLAGPGVNGKEILKSQTIGALELAGTPKEFIKVNSNFMEIMLSEIHMGKDVKKMIKNVESKLIRYHSSLSDSIKNTIPLETIMQQFTSLANDPWMQYFIKTEPKEFLSEVEVPILAINGSKDIQVIPEINLPAIETILNQSSNKDYTIKKIENLNHLFQHSDTGATSEYESIDETFDIETLDLITNWISKRF